jgi:hypothetical protein
VYRSQIEAPLPSSKAAPSHWNAEEIAPQAKSAGKAVEEVGVAHVEHDIR